MQEVDPAEELSDVPSEAPAGKIIVLDPSWPSVRVIARVVMATLLLVFIAGFVERILASLNYLIFLVVLSVLLAYLTDPLVRIIRRPFKERNLDRLMPRAAAIIVAYIFVFAVLSVFVANIAPQVMEQAKEFGRNLPEYGNSFRERAGEINHRFEQIQIPEEVQIEINKKIADIGSETTAAVGSFVLATVTYLPLFVLVPILSFFLLKDANQFRLAILRMFPAGRWRYRSEMVLQDVNTTLAAYTRAQIISCMIIALICTLGFYVLGLKYALLLGILAGVFEFVPLLGPALIGVIVTLTALFSDDPRKALYVAIFLIVLRIVHDYVTYPRIVRGGIHLHPLAIILSVLAGEQIAGIPGVFLSIPLVAVATVIYRHVLEHRGGRGLVHSWLSEEELPVKEVS